MCVSRYPVAIPLRAGTTHTVSVMTFHRRVGSRAPLMAFTAALLALLLLPALVLGAEWTTPRRVSDVAGTRLDSLHQLAADRGKMHLTHPRIGPGTKDDRVFYQRSTNGGATWSKGQPLFKATARHRHVVPNLAIDARGDIVAVAWRAGGPSGSTLFVRVSRDGGQNFGNRDEITTTSKDHGIGVPAIAVGKDAVAVAWTNRATGKIKVRISRDDGRTFKPAESIGSTRLSIDCRAKQTDGLVGIAAASKSIHVAWSHAPLRSCIASSVEMRTSTDRGKSWGQTRTVTERRSYGWPELDARGRTVLATVQSPSGGLVVARSDKNGRKWTDQVLKPPERHGYSAADVTLLPDKKAIITYVDEVIRNDLLTRTRVAVRRSPNDGVKWSKPRPVTSMEKKLRMAPNIAANGKKISIVFQSGQFDGSPRNIFATRLR